MKVEDALRLPLGRIVGAAWWEPGEGWVDPGDAPAWAPPVVTDEQMALVEELSREANIPVPMVFEMTPGIREMPRLPHRDDSVDVVTQEVERAILRQQARILRELDSLPGAARVETMKAFQEFEVRLKAEVRKLLNVSDISTMDLITLDDVIHRELELFRSNVMTRHRKLSARAIKAGRDLADVPAKVLGLDLPGAGPGMPEGVVDAQGFWSYDFSPSKISVYQSDIRENVIRILDAVKTGKISQNTGINALRDKIQGPRYNAERVMRTEVSRLGAKATQERMVESNRVLPMEKWWRTTMDSRARSAHILANNQVRAVDEYFDVGGERVLYPRGPFSTARNSVNCRCNHVAKPKLGAEVPVATKTAT